MDRTRNVRTPTLASDEITIEEEEVPEPADETSGYHPNSFLPIVVDDSSANDVFLLGAPPDDMIHPPLSDAHPDYIVPPNPAIKRDPIRGLHEPDSARKSLSSEEALSRLLQRMGVSFVGPIQDLCYEMLRFAPRDDRLRQNVLDVKPDEAQGLLDALQTWLDSGSGDDHLRRRALYLLKGVSSSHRKLPRALFLHGVTINPGEICGMGGFSDVFCGSYQQRKVAFKRLRVLPAHKANYLQLFCREALMWRQLDHPNVLPFWGIDLESSSPFCCMVSPWMSNGTIDDFVRSDRYNPIRDRFRLLQETAEGLAYLHSQKITHGDIKSTNILIDDNDHAVLADFGLAVIGEFTAGRMALGGTIGSVGWMPPESLDRKGDTQPSGSCDIYALGCLLYFLHTRRAPFFGISPALVAGNVISGIRPLKPTKLECHGLTMSNSSWSLIERCWRQEPRFRPTARDVAETAGILLSESDNSATHSADYYYGDSDGFSSMELRDQTSRLVVPSAPVLPNATYKLEPGAYMLINAESDLIMDLCGTDRTPILGRRLKTVTTNLDGVKWEFIATDADNVFHIRSVVTGRYISVRGKAKHGINLTTSDTPALWKVIPSTSPGIFQICWHEPGQSRLRLAIPRPSWLREQLRSAIADSSQGECVQILSINKQPRQDWKLIQCVTH